LRSQVPRSSLAGPSSDKRTDVRTRSGLPAGPERPRERLLRHGAGVLSDAELLAVVLRTGLPGCNVIELSQRLLAKFGGLRGLLGADAQQLAGAQGLGPAKTSQSIAILELARRSMAEQLTRKRTLNRPELTQAYCMALLGHHTVEVCMALYLDNQLRLI